INSERVSAVPADLQGTAEREARLGGRLAGHAVVDGAFLRHAGCLSAVREHLPAEPGVRRLWRLPGLHLLAVPAWLRVRAGRRAECVPAPTSALNRTGGRTTHHRHPP